MQKTVLVIDDDHDIREVAKTSLELVGGFTVLLAENGTVGIEVAQQAQPDAILLDLMMPDLDGHQTLLQLKRLGLTSAIPVIMLTAKVQASRQEFVAKGAAGVLVKPFDPLQLPSQVCEIMGWSIDGKDSDHRAPKEE